MPQRKEEEKEEQEHNNNSAENGAASLPFGEGKRGGVEGGSDKTRLHITGLRKWDHASHVP